MKRCRTYPHCPGACDGWPNCDSLCSSTGNCPPLCRRCRVRAWALNIAAVVALAMIVASLLIGCVEAPKPEPVDDPMCADAVALSRSLGAQYSERPLGIGMSSLGRHVLMVGPKSWTVLALREDGKACVVAAGIPTPEPKGDPL